MAQQIIKAKPEVKRAVPEGEEYLEVAEFYCDTIQGEGAYTGVPASFLRMQNCVLNCKWCDTKEVWRFGNPYTITELLDLMEDYELPRKFKSGQHFVLTGGDPLIQQDQLTILIKTFIARFGFKPIIEIENEGALMPEDSFAQLIDIWNNSPKTNNSRNPKPLRYKPEVLTFLRDRVDSWFKFVVYEEGDWLEIEDDFLNPGLIHREQVILMPRGETMEELNKNRPYAVETAIREGVRYCSREHIVLWDTATGV